MAIDADLIDEEQDVVEHRGCLIGLLRVIVRAKKLLPLPQF
jgi:hypothetical protein